ncbi:MAG: hypothetical protein Q4B78_05345, partial [Bacillota bacterium]|nr:hypothetical protein [Bacillota bacterium]
AEAEFIDKQRLYTEIITPYFISNSNLTSADFDRLEKNYKEYYRRAKKVGLDTVLKELEAEKYQVKEADCEKYLYRWGFGMTSFPSKSYGEPRMVKFEDDYFPVACESEVTMRVAYGDSWMYVPERDNQIVHSTMKNLDTPFEKYTDEYVPLIDRDELFRAYRKVKNVEIEQFAIRLRENLVIAKAKALIAEEKIRRELLPRKDEVIQAYKNEDKESLDRLLACIYDTMLQKDLVRNGISPEVDEDLFVIAVMNLIKQGLYYKAEKLIQGVINNKLYDCEGIKQARLVIDKCRVLSIAIYDYKDEKKASVALEELEDIMPELVDYKRGKLWLLMKEAEGDNEWQRLEAFAAESVELFPWDGEIEHFLGIAEYHMGNQEKARETFEDAVHKTRNAFVWQRAFELVGINRIATA